MDHNRKLQVLLFIFGQRERLRQTKWETTICLDDDTTNWKDEESLSGPRLENREAIVPPWKIVFIVSAALSL